MAIFSKKNAPYIAAAAVVALAVIAYVIWWAIRRSLKEGARGRTPEYEEKMRRRKETITRLNAVHGQSGNSKFSVREWNVEKNQWLCPEGSADTGRQWGDGSGKSHRQCQWWQ